MANVMRLSTNEPEQVLLSLHDASQQLCIAVPTLRRWLREGRLAHVRCGRAVRIEATEIQRFIERNRHPATNEQKHSTSRKD